MGFRTFFFNANLDDAELNRSILEDASLTYASMRGCRLSCSSLLRTSLIATDLTGADLSNTNLRYVQLVDTDLTDACLRGASIYGASVWRVRTTGADQRDLSINPHDEALLTCDNIEVAQFLDLLTHNETIRRTVDTITSKVVLILGRFTSERKVVLDSLRDELRKRNYLPVLFDFEKPASRDITETISTLAHMARFVIADITDARSIPQELMAIVPNLPSVPVQPLLLSSQHEYGMFEHFKRYEWVLKPYLYDDQEGLLAALPDRVVGPAEAMARRQTGR